MAKKFSDTEKKKDALLNIHTTGRVSSHADENHHPYEATPYAVLDRLIDEGYVDSSDHVVDYGSGKGRVSIYLAKMTGCGSTGIEYDPQMYTASLENLSRCGVENVSFLNMDAEDYLPEGADRFFFFNPFSAKILCSVISKIKDSWYDEPRNMKMFFYYPDDEYILVLMQDDLLMFSDEIYLGDIMDKKDKRERIMIFETGSGEEL